jgi:hypothetical protein
MSRLNRRRFLGYSALAAAAPLERVTSAWAGESPRADRPAQVAITLDLEMSREYPKRGMTEWDYEKGNLDEDTKRYAVEAGRIVRERGGRIHYFCVGRVLEQPDVEWLKQLAADGHAIGNHTYDHVNVLAQRPEDIQFRFRRAPWLIAGRQAEDVIRENVKLTTTALSERAGITANGFRTPGGFSEGLAGRRDVQEMLLEQGFSWVSSKYPRHETGVPKQKPGDDVLRSIIAAQTEAQPFKYEETSLIEVPMSPISDVNAFRSNFWKLPWFVEAIERAVQWAIEHGGVFDLLAHPSCLVVEDPKHETIRRICELVEAAGERAKVCTLDEIAALL